MHYLCKKIFDKKKATYKIAAFFVNFFARRLLWQKQQRKKESIS